MKFIIFLVLLIGSSIFISEILSKYFKVKRINYHWVLVAALFATSILSGLLDLAFCDGNNGMFCYK